MNTIDATEHYETSAHDRPPSLLTIILDTNPHAWALLNPSLPLSTAIANILVFINAHLACNYANEVAVVSSHTSQATWLYPVEKATTTTAANNLDSDGDISMRSQQPPPSTHTNVNKYRPFRIVEEQVSTHLHNLMSQTTPETLQSTTSTMMAGALTLALSHINRRTLAWNEAHGGDIDTTNPNDPSSTSSSSHNTKGTAESTLQSRILILSVSSSTGSAHQYIPIMNAIFACQRLHIPIDVCKVSGDAVFLQQASDATKGVYMALDEPKGLLQYLMMAFLPDQRSRRHLVLPTRVDVDFRAACFCHRRVVDVGFVCSICLSIFCEPLGDGVCLTCGSRLDVSDYGAKPAVVARKKKKKKVKGNGMSAAGTPTPTPTPGP
ncbi:RNA polymerase II transcription factor B subunit 4 [Aspergillus awamori]|uniref:General transcription and DNA repair factor IIH subunit TFB4 n=2 Tax=Aspergillus TaxID=5052 RepID=A0A3F3Q6P2_9EURO|nr:transcription factor TFIIH complex subunit [Aspergillus welwitschiae]GCB22041.1 RNA polymerase II transcription factor B subunit 4 [Aspergillus awamori]GKZ60631.1 RNA polymerase II transcription factor B subunit 4 [Aspergillus niger]RDH34894.1 transcription factor TFIIH complex subunit [Aspergillus welwitschiae]GKZ65257.1 RNA polymerase II transcription factor B subunit 4 [Aspergillus niger]GLA05150.1 RNA polymerase II transcription factor B subunit 4 [Aspergillus niger]